MRREDLVEEALRLYLLAVGIVDPVRLRAWADLGLTMPTLKVLLLLREEPGAPSGVLAARLGVSPSTVTGLVDRLAARGFVRRHEDREDRRLVRNVLTEEGAAAMRDLELRSRALLTEVLGRLDYARLVRLVAALDDLNRAAQAPAPAGAR